MTPLISVVLAACDGEAFLPLQTESILGQLGEEDELIITLDPSSDRSKELCLRLAENDHRVVFLQGPGRGVIANFEHGLSRARGEFVFLSDQDDVWAKSKVCECLEALRCDKVVLVVHNALITDSGLNHNRKTVNGNKFYKSFLLNFIKNKYRGCCMAFRRSLLDFALPFPPDLPMHDQWLGVVAQKLGRVEYINLPLILYRRHSANATEQSRTGLVQKLRWRFALASGYLRFLGKVRRYGRH